MTDFKPLDFGRRLDADESLDVYEYAVLNALARGADNQTYKVRRSLSAIATAAKIKKHQTVSDILTRPHVAKYLAKVERAPRRVDVWLRQDPHGRGTDKPLVRGTDKHSECSNDALVRPTDKTWPSHGQDMAVGRTPSALSPPSALVGLAAAESDGESQSLTEAEVLANMAQAPSFEDEPESPPSRTPPPPPPLLTEGLTEREVLQRKRAHEHDMREQGLDPMGNPLNRPVPTSRRRRH